MALATIRRILNIEPIPDADAIQKATVLGWSVVVKKDEFNIGDLCVYCEIDSVLPNEPEFEFLKDKRIRTVRLRKQISQGICFPLSILPDGFGIYEGMDVTEAVGVTKYEKPIPMSARGDVKGPFPEWIPKTDEPRIQSMPQLIQRYAGVDFFYTEKLDGTSCTVFIDDQNELNVCGRNWNLKRSEASVYWNAIENSDIEKKLRLAEERLGYRVALQGEVCGPNVQQNKLALSRHSFFAFNMFNIDHRCYVGHRWARRVFNELEITAVPFLGVLKFNSDMTMDEIVRMSILKSSINPKAWAEGIVCRPETEITDDEIGRLSFKIVNPEFLLKHGE